MPFFHLILRNLRYYRSHQVWVFLGCTLATAVLIGSLAVGDSVRGTLEANSHRRLGRIDFVLNSGDRFFRAALATRLSNKGVPTEAGIQLSGVLALPEGDPPPATGVQVLGIDDMFFSQASNPVKLKAPESGQIFVNARAAELLSIKPGDSTLLTVEKPGLMPREAPLADDDQGVVRRRMTLARVLTSDELGDFSLQADPLPPATVFMRREDLALALEHSQKANLLMFHDVSKDSSIDVLQDTLRGEWALEDAGIQLRQLDEACEVLSDQIFISPPLESMVRHALPDATGVMTTLVNEISFQERHTPYSFVTGLQPDLVPSHDEIAVNQWLAQDLEADVGDDITLTYFVLGPMRHLQEQNATLRIRSVLPMQGLAADSKLMPPFPGLSGTDNCRDWDPSYPIDLDRVRDKDEAYWDQFKGTPKAFVSLRTAQKLWGNRFGQLTALRVRGISCDQVHTVLQAQLDPAQLGFLITPSQDLANRAQRGSTDFGQLFIGLSFFILASALFLSAMLYSFSIIRRQREVTTLRALGWSARKIFAMLLWEAAAWVFLSTGIGLGLGLLYTRGILAALTHFWQGAMGPTTIEYHVWPQTLVLGAGISALLAMGSMTLTLRRCMSRPVSRSLAVPGPRAQHRLWIHVCLSILFLGSALGLTFSVDAESGKSVAGLFFAAGALGLAGFGTLWAAFLAWSPSHKPTQHLTRRVMILRSLARNPNRSLTTFLTLACGLFLILAVAANQHDPLRHADQNASGTGGYDLIGHTAIPLLHAMETEDGRHQLNMNAPIFQHAAFAACRQRAGDDASCLNLNRSQTPALLGVPWKSFRQRGSFSFASTLSGPANGAQPWQLLEHPIDAYTWPAIADQTVITWGYGMSLGDEFTLQDEFGQPIKLRLVAGLNNSVFQGQLLVSKALFEKHYPSQSGTTWFLVDHAHENIQALGEALQWALEDRGLTLVTTRERLAALAQVELTYLRIFLALGGLGLLIGTLGLALVVLRNLSDRQSELAVLHALGFKKATLLSMLMAEHGLILGCSAFCGTLASALAVLPALAHGLDRLPLGSILALILAMLCIGISAVWLGLHIASKEEPLQALRRE